MITATIQWQLQLLPDDGGRQSSLAISTELAKQDTRGMTVPAFQKHVCQDEYMSRRTKWGKDFI